MTIPPNTIIQGDALQVLRTLPSGSIHCCVTSPPYWALRDYGVDGQYGLESSPQEYIDNMVLVFSEVRRVLHDDGTLWLNMGDTYATGAGKQGNKRVSGKSAYASSAQPKQEPNRLPIDGLKRKDLIGMPWRLAFALQADGWYLRQDIIWHKSNPMPESTKDRCTKSHEYIFLLSKNEKYFFDSEAIKEERTSNEDAATFRGGCYVNGNKDNNNTGQRRVVGNKMANSFARKTSSPVHPGQSNTQHRADRDPIAYEGTRNKRSVWKVATAPFRAAHFATFPPKLILPCILAGCPADGIVLDPFMGSGTVAVVARQTFRHYIGIELNPKYITLAQERIKEEVTR